MRPIKPQKPHWRCPRMNLRAGNAAAHVACKVAADRYANACSLQSLRASCCGCCSGCCKKHVEAPCGRAQHKATPTSTQNGARVCVRFPCAAAAAAAAEVSPPLPLDAFLQWLYPFAAALSSSLYPAPLEDAAHGDPHNSALLEGGRVRYQTSLRVARRGSGHRTVQPLL